ncbi:TRAP dicarboxylate transporter subunit DctP [Actinobacillus equuli]|nr:TRAP dicarboxylate transporter subunit DctP [Actinobacillus equuli]
MPMPLSELYTALETKAVDAQEHPIGIVWSAKLYEVQNISARPITAIHR